MNRIRSAPVPWRARHAPGSANAVVESPESLCLSDLLSKY
jgi:hypothetical protein